MAAKGAPPKVSLIQSSIWILIVVVFLDISWSKIGNLRVAGQYVNPWRYAEMVFWVFLMLFWGWNLWKSWQRYHADKG
jgi:hypothetical protein